MTREHQLQRFLFEAIQARNGRVELDPRILLGGLSNCLGADNKAVAQRAAEELRELQPKLVREMW